MKTGSDAYASLLEKVKDVVDERVGAFVAAFFSDSRSTTRQIADRIDAISDAVLGGCDDSGVRDGESAKSLRMATSRVEALDRMRLGRPAVYAAVRASASNLAFAPPLEQRAALSAAIASIASIAK